MAALALGVRLLTVVAVNYYAHPIHDTGVWLADEASFFLATEAIWRDPLNRLLPQGLEHLSGDGYLGLTTAFAWFGNVADANTFRVVNAGLGSAAVILSTLIARRLFSPRAALISGVALAVWPTLVLWSATMLRDTLASFVVVGVWWTLTFARELGWLRTLGAVFLALVIVLSLRPYLGVAVVAGVLVWGAYSRLHGLSRRNIAIVGASAAAVTIGVLATQWPRLDSIVNDVVYRQSVAEMENLGKLYIDQPLADPGDPLHPGVVVGMPDPRSGWLLIGVVQDYASADSLSVAFTDDSTREVARVNVQPLQQIRIAPAQLAASLAQNVVKYLTGTSITSNPAWILIALAWDVLLVMAALAWTRLGVSGPQWLFPLCVVLFTVLALIAVPGAPANIDRHRATQTLPFLVVLASGLAASGAYPKDAAAGRRPLRFRSAYSSARPGPNPARTPSGPESG